MKTLPLSVVHCPLQSLYALVTLALSFAGDLVSVSDDQWRELDRDMLRSRDNVVDLADWRARHG